MPNKASYCHPLPIGNQTVVDRGDDWLCVLIRYIGYFLMAQSTVIKAPQILKMYLAKNGAGVTEFGTILEIIGYSITCIYPFQNMYPFGDWGEGVFLAFESAVVYLMIEYYKQMWLYFYGFLLVYIPSVVVLMFPFWPMVFLQVLQSMASFMVSAGKLAQVWRNWRNKHTGYLSMVMMIMLTDNSVLRILSAIFKQNDIILLLNFISITVINLIIIGQMIYYKQNTQEFLEKDKLQLKKNNSKNENTLQQSSNDAKSEAKSDTKSDVESDVKSDAKSDVNSDAKSVNSDVISANSSNKKEN